MVVNQTSVFNRFLPWPPKTTHLVDSLLALNIPVKKIFAPEHGFRGEADAGEKVIDGIDAKTGLPIFSLYGETKKPTDEMLKSIDIMVFDIQDVGARFYTYISTLHHVMEACAENGIPLIVLDRPNPNGFYVDGPVLKPEFKSFVGMHPVPVVYGMTIGEYAQMINGEQWLSNGMQCELSVIPCNNYDHTMTYNLPIKPSPNLPNLRAILLYPSLCFFEGTTVSIGRGTDNQFQIIGHPEYDIGSYAFKPVSKPGANYPKHEDVMCFGQDLSSFDLTDLKREKKLNLSYLIEYYNFLRSKTQFFLDNNFFDKLAGTDQLKKQIIDDLSEAQIRATWQEDLLLFKQTRKKYLLYPDFE